MVQRAVTRICYCLAFCTNWLTPILSWILSVEASSGMQLIFPRSTGGCFYGTLLGFMTRHLPSIKLSQGFPSTLLNLGSCSTDLQLLRSARSSNGGGSWRRFSSRYLHACLGVVWSLELHGPRPGVLLVSFLCWTRLQLDYSGVTKATYESASYHYRVTTQIPPRLFYHSANCMVCMHVDLVQHARKYYVLWILWAMHNKGTCLP